MGCGAFLKLPGPRLGGQRNEAPSATTQSHPEAPFILDGGGEGTQENVASAPVPLARDWCHLHCRLAFGVKPPPSSAGLPFSSSFSDLPQHRQRSKSSSDYLPPTPTFYFRFYFPLFKPESIPTAGTGNLALPNFSHSLTEDTDGLSDPQSLHRGG